MQADAQKVKLQVDYGSEYFIYYHVDKIKNTVKQNNAYCVPEVPHTGISWQSYRATIVLDPQLFQYRQEYVLSRVIHVKAAE